MKSTILAIASFAALASGGAHADQYFGADGVLKFDGSRTRAEVKAEAVSEARYHGNAEYTGMQPTQFAKSSSVDAKVVRAEAAEAVRLGQIPRGEAGPV